MSLSDRFELGRPLGQGTFGTTHLGRELATGRAVAIKVQRPRIDEIVSIDLRAVEWAVRVVRNYPPIKRRADLLALFEEFKRRGAKIDYELENKPYQVREFGIQDLDGYDVAFGQPLPPQA